MKIKCKLKRDGGTKIELFGKTYHFKPEDTDLKPGTEEYKQADHVCDVSDDSAIHRLCTKIREAYEPVDAGATIPQPTQTVRKANTIAGESKPEAKPVIIRDASDNEINLSELEPEKLRELAKAEFGINVHHKWADQTIIAKIVEKTRGED